MQTNFFKQNRLIYKKGEPLPPSPAPKGAGLPDELRGDPFYYARFPKKQKTEKALGKMKQEQERKKLAKEIPDKVTSEKEEKIKKRWKKEIYRGNEKLRDRYFESVKDAIEKLPKDELYEFIFNHTPAGDNWYEKGEYTTWNREFAELINPYLPEDLQTTPKQVQRHKYIAGGLQNYILQYFKPNNVFQAGRSKRMTNPFIYTDGKMGSYTISVMAEYWNHKYGQSKKQPLGNGDLDDAYAGKRKNRKIYDKALVYLDRTMGRTPRSVTTTPDVQVATVSSAPKAPKKKLEILRNNITAELASKNASQEAIFAFNKSYEKKFRSAMRPMIMELRKEGRFTHGDPEAWAEVHEKMIASNAVYRTAFESAPAPAGATAKTTEVAEGTKEEAEEKLVISDKIVEGRENEESLSKERFVNYLCKRMELKGVDFLSGSTKTRRMFAEDIRALCVKAGLPASTALADIVITKIHRQGKDKLKYGGLYDHYFLDNKKTLHTIEGVLRKEYLNEDFDEAKDILDKKNFAYSMEEIIQDENIKFKGVHYSVHGARINFGEEMYTACKDLDLPTNEETAREIAKILLGIVATATDGIKYSGASFMTKYAAGDRDVLNKVRNALIKVHPKAKIPKQRLGIARQEVQVEKETGIGKSAFVDVAMKMIDKADYDFNEPEKSSRKYFSKEIADKLMEEGVPLTINMASRIIDELNHFRNPPDSNNIDYDNRPDAEEKIVNREIVDGVIAGLLKGKRSEKPMISSDDAFMDEVLAVMDTDFDFDFEGTFSDESKMRRKFVTDVLEKCKKLKIPITSKLAEDIPLILDHRFVLGEGVGYRKGDNDFDIYNLKSGNEATNEEIVDIMAYYLAKEYGKSTDFYLKETMETKKKNS